MINTNLSECQLFSGLNNNEITDILHKVSATERKVDKGEYVCLNGDRIKCIGLISCGSVQVLSSDFQGNSSIYSVLNNGDVFGEALISAKNSTIPFDLLALTDTIIMFIDPQKLNEENLPLYQYKLILNNIIAILSKKTIMFRQTIEHLSRRTIRSKVISFLSSEAKKNNSYSFTISFNRQQLADYLAIDRSALSSELSKMRKDGLIEYNKNTFCIIK